MAIFKTGQPVKGYGKAIPPPLHFVNIYFTQKGRRLIEAREFFEFYSANKWTTPRCKKVRDWKAAANDWIWNIQQREKQRK